VTTTALDGFGRPTQTVNALGEKVTTKYDGDGRVVYERFPFTTVDKGLTVEFDALGRVTRRINPDDDTNPNNNTFSSWTCGDDGAVSIADENAHLPDAGTYTIKVDPQSSAAGSVTLTLYNVPTDPTATVTVGGGSQTLTTTTPGQNATATFTGSSGQQVTVRITNNGLGSTYVRLYKPDGVTQLTFTLSSASSFNLVTQTFQTPGTYTILIDPNTTPNTGSISVAVTSP
jgi:YD repeat-containing protein